MNGDHLRFYKEGQWVDLRDFLGGVVNEVASFRLLYPRGMCLPSVLPMRGISMAVHFSPEK